MGGGGSYGRESEDQRAGVMICGQISLSKCGRAPSSSSIFADNEIHILREDVLVVPFYRGFCVVRLEMETTNHLCSMVIHTT